MLAFKHFAACAALTICVWIGGLSVPPAHAQVVTQYDYDAIGRVCRARVATGETVNYGYDKNGNQTAVTQALSGGETTSSVCTQVTGTAAGASAARSRTNHAPFVLFSQTIHVCASKKFLAYEYDEEQLDEANSYIYNPETGETIFYPVFITVHITVPQAIVGCVGTGDPRSGGTFTNDATVINALRWAFDFDLDALHVASASILTGPGSVAVTDTSSITVTPNSSIAAQATTQISVTIADSGGATAATTIDIIYDQIVVPAP